MKDSSYSEQIENEKVGDRIREGEDDLQFTYSKDGDYAEIYLRGFSFQVSGDFLEKIMKCRENMRVVG